MTIDEMITQYYRDQNRGGWYLPRMQTDIERWYIFNNDDNHHALKDVSYGASDNIQLLEVNMLLKQLKKDLLLARRKNDRASSKILSTLYSEAAMIGKNNGNRETFDWEVIDVVRKFIKNIVETLENLPPDDYRVHDLNHELTIIKPYLPVQLTDSELMIIIDDIVKEKENPPVNQMGLIMGALKARYPGQYEGKTASRLVKKALLAVQSSTTTP